MVPPQTLPRPPFSPGVARQSGWNGLAAPMPNREWPGWLSVYRRAVDVGTASVLNALAVNALALAMAWLPTQACAGSGMDTATAHNLPSRFTSAAHSALP